MDIQIYLLAISPPKPSRGCRMGIIGFAACWAAGTVFPRPTEADASHALSKTPRSAVSFSIHSVTLTILLVKSTKKERLSLEAKPLPRGCGAAMLIEAVVVWAHVEQAWGVGEHGPDLSDGVDSAGRFGIGEASGESEPLPGRHGEGGGSAEAVEVFGVKVTGQGVKGVQLGSALRVAPPSRCGANRQGPFPIAGKGSSAVGPLDSLSNRFTYAVSAPTAMPSAFEMRQARVGGVSGHQEHLWTPNNKPSSCFVEMTASRMKQQVPPALWPGLKSRDISHQPRHLIFVWLDPVSSCQLHWVRSLGPLLHCSSAASSVPAAGMWRFSTTPSPPAIVFCLVTSEGRNDRHPTAPPDGSLGPATSWFWPGTRSQSGARQAH